MTSLRENPRRPAAADRYLTFDSELRRRRSWSNKWEVVLVVLIIAAGVVITTIAAIKAGGEYVS